jgi:thiamine biosynthesis lipoprotein ApbE
MRYLITGEWNRHRVMRLIMVFFSFYVAGFWLTSALLYFLHMDLTPLSVIRYYRGDDALFMPPQSYQSLLELTHVHLFAMGVLLVTLTHLLLFVPGSDRRKAALAAAVLASGFIESTSGWLVRYVHPLFSLVKIGSFLTLQLSTALVLVFIIKALRAKNKLSYQDEAVLAAAEARRMKQRGSENSGGAGSGLGPLLPVLFVATSVLHPARADSNLSDKTSADISASNLKEVIVQSRPAMGTMLSVSLCRIDTQGTQHIFDRIFKKVEEVEEHISEWRPSSEVSRIVASAGIRAEKISADTERFLRRSLLMWRETDGFFDITYRTARGTNSKADDKRSSRSPILLDAGRAFLREEGAIIDTGGIGKGFALDELVPIVIELGISCALFDFGGSSFLAIGSPEHAEGWRLVGEDSGQRPIFLRDKAASTSSSLAIADSPSQSHPHIVDPKTNKTVNTPRQATILCDSAAIADALSTYSIVVGEKKAEAVVKKLSCEKDSLVSVTEALK